jgi:hypothetical protein
VVSGPGSIDIDVTHIEIDVRDHGNAVSDSLPQPFARQTHAHGSLPQLPPPYVRRCLPSNVHYGIDDLEMPRSGSARGV